MRPIWLNLISVYKQTSLIRNRFQQPFHKYVHCINFNKWRKKTFRAIFSKFSCKIIYHAIDRICTQPSVTRNLFIHYLPFISLGCDICTRTHVRAQLHCCFAFLFSKIINHIEIKISFTFSNMNTLNLEQRNNHLANKLKSNGKFYTNRKI